MPHAVLGTGNTAKNKKDRNSYLHPSSLRLVDQTKVGLTSRSQISGSNLDIWYSQISKYKLI